MQRSKKVTGRHYGGGQTFVCERFTRMGLDGLTLPSLSETTRATVEWFRKQPVERQLKMRAGIKPQREAEVLTAWHAKK